LRLWATDSHRLHPRRQVRGKSEDGAPAIAFQHVLGVPDSAKGGPAVKVAGREQHHVVGVVGRVERVPLYRHGRAVAFALLRVSLATTNRNAGDGKTQPATHRLGVELVSQVAFTVREDVAERNRLDQGLALSRWDGKGESHAAEVPPGGNI